MASQRVASGPASQRDAVCVPESVVRGHHIFIKLCGHQGLEKYCLSLANQATDIIDVLFA